MSRFHQHSPSQAAQGPLRMPARFSLLQMPSTHLDCSTSLSGHDSYAYASALQGICCQRRMIVHVWPV
eukprot:2679985-Rhodomonas_salina.1